MSSRSHAARKAKRPMRPNPLIPTLIAIFPTSYCVDFIPLCKKFGTP
jgi:hypothetical protein